MTRCSPGGAFRQLSILLSEVFHSVGPVAHQAEEDACRCRHGRRPTGVSRGAMLLAWRNRRKSATEDVLEARACTLRSSSGMALTGRKDACQDVLLAVDSEFQSRGC